MVQLKILKKCKTSLMGVGGSSGDESGSIDEESNNIVLHGYNEGEGDTEEEVALVLPSLPSTGDTKINEENREAEGVCGSEDVDSVTGALSGSNSAVAVTTLVGREI